MNFEMITIGCMECMNTVRVPAYTANGVASGFIPCPVCKEEAGALIADARELPDYAAVKKPIMRDGTEVAANYYVFSNEAGKLVTQFAYGTMDAAQSAADSMMPAEPVTEPAAVEFGNKPCPGFHREHIRCINCNAFRAAKLTADSAGDWYRAGRLSQVEYEGYMYVWATSATRYNPGSWGASPTDPAVIEFAAALCRHAGLPAPVELVA